MPIRGFEKIQRSCQTNEYCSRTQKTWSKFRSICWKLHYTEDCSKWNHTKRVSHVLLIFTFFAPDFYCLDDSHCNEKGSCNNVLGNCACEEDWNSYLDCTFCKFRINEPFQKTSFSASPSPSSPLIFSDCPYLELLGDGFCNDESNNANCNFDGGDCCININKDHCSDCICHHQENCVTGFTPSIVADGFCNDETNNIHCFYDDGDCCAYNANTDLCSDCRCYLNETCAAGTHPLVGDGFCNDETNHDLCYYDAGDCCGVDVNKDLCSECICWCKAFSIISFLKIIKNMLKSLALHNTRTATDKDGTLHTDF